MQTNLINVFGAYGIAYLGLFLCGCGAYAWLVFIDGFHNKLEREKSNWHRKALRVTLMFVLGYLIINGFNFILPYTSKWLFELFPNGNINGSLVSHCGDFSNKIRYAILGAPIFEESLYRVGLASTAQIYLTRKILRSDKISTAENLIIVVDLLYFVFMSIMVLVGFIGVRDIENLGDSLVLLSTAIIGWIMITAVLWKRLFKRGNIRNSKPNSATLLILITVLFALGHLSNFCRFPTLPTIPIAVGPQMMSGFIFGTFAYRFGYIGLLLGILMHILNNLTAIWQICAV